MTPGDPNDLSNLSMMELFQAEAENQAAIITDSLLELEQSPGSTQLLEALMRAAHSLKGAARIVHKDTAVSVAHALEDCFVAAQQGKIPLDRNQIDVVFEGVDLLMRISNQPDDSAIHAENARHFLADLVAITDGHAGQATISPPSEFTLPSTTETKLAPTKPDSSGRVLRLTAQTLNRLLGLAGESLVESRWLHPFADSMLRLKRLQADVMTSLDGLRDARETQHLPEHVGDQINDAIQKAAECRQLLSDRLADLEMYDRRSSNLSHRLYREVLKCRMRPFSEGARRFPRMVRDLAQLLGKQVRLEIVGENTQVDREILEKLEDSLGHLLRNAVDHGCETPEERRRLGKPEECTIRLEARHTAGTLLITVADDGAGIEPEKLRENIRQKLLVTPAAAEKLNEPQLLDFLLLPGFTMRDTVTEISGRGVGLDVVQNMVRSVRGNIRIAAHPGRGMRFQLQLPLTLSVVRVLLVDVAGEPYAIPLSQISQTLKLSATKIATLEGRHHFTMGDRQIGLLTAHQVLGHRETPRNREDFPVVVLGDRVNRYGLVVDRFLGERELVVQALDPRLGKVPNISSGSLMEDGSPVLIMDVDEVFHSIESLVVEGRLEKVLTDMVPKVSHPAKRILIVDDSPTVRELERKLLAAHGYIMDCAVDGMDALNAVRVGNYDLVISDVDMPRMNGIELASLIKHEVNLKSLQVMIVSYKDRPEDRQRGLEAGADHYLTKGAFEDDTLIRAVVELIGKAGA